MQLNGQHIQLCQDHYDQAKQQSLTSTDDSEIVHHNQQGITRCVVPNCKKPVTMRVSTANVRQFNPDSKEEANQNVDTNPQDAQPVDVTEGGGEANP